MGDNTQTDKPSRYIKLKTHVNSAFYFCGAGKLSTRLRTVRK